MILSKRVRVLWRVGVLIYGCHAISALAVGAASYNSLPQLTFYAQGGDNGLTNVVASKEQAIMSLVAAGRWRQLASAYKQDEALMGLYPSAAIALAEQVADSDTGLSKAITTKLLANESALTQGQQTSLNQLVIRHLMIDGQSDEALREILRVQKHGGTLSDALIAEVALSQLYVGQNISDLSQLKPLSAPFQLISRVIEWKNAGLDNAQLSAALIKQLNDKNWQPGASFAKLPMWISNQLGNDSLSFQSTVWTMSANQILANEQKEAILAEWQRLGERVANRRQLLQGDDAGWIAAMDALPSEQQWEGVVLSARLLSDTQDQTVKTAAAKQLMQRLAAYPIAQWRVLTLLKVDNFSTWLSGLDRSSRWVLLSHMKGTEATSAEMYRIWQTVLNDLPIESRLDFAKAAMAAGATTELRQSIIQWLAQDSQQQLGSHVWLTPLMREWFVSDVNQATLAWREFAPILSAKADTKDLDALCSIAALFQDWPGVMQFGGKAWQTNDLGLQGSVRSLLMLALTHLGYIEEARLLGEQALSKAGSVSSPLKPTKNGKK